MSIVIRPYSSAELSEVIAVTRATLTPEMVEHFVADTERFAQT